MNEWKRGLLFLEVQLIKHIFFCPTDDQVLFLEVILKHYTENA